jgi:hypothetical protein
MKQISCQTHLPELIADLLTEHVQKTGQTVYGFVKTWVLKGMQAEGIVIPTELPRKKRRLQARCKHGHPLQGDNLYVSPDGQRNCRECNRESARTYCRQKSKKAQRAEASVQSDAA